MDTSTLIFIATLAVVFIFLRWIISPIPNASSEWNELENARENDARTNRVTRAGTPGRRREVTNSMIEVVQAIAPHLSTGQIRMDLERSGSVEVTVERYMEEGGLPFPEGESASDLHPLEESEKTNNQYESENLIDRYGLNEKVDSASLDELEEATWGTDKSERRDLLQKRRENMILKARKRLASQLQNEISMP